MNKLLIASIVALTGCANVDPINKESTPRYEKTALQQSRCPSYMCLKLDSVPGSLPPNDFASNPCSTFGYSGEINGVCQYRMSRTQSPYFNRIFPLPGFRCSKISNTAYRCQTPEGSWAVKSCAANAYISHYEYLSYGQPTGTNNDPWTVYSDPMPFVSATWSPNELGGRLYCRYTVFDKRVFAHPVKVGI